QQIGRIAGHIQHLHEVIAAADRDHGKPWLSARGDDPGNNLVDRSVSTHGHNDIAPTSGFARQLRGVTRILGSYEVEGKVRLLESTQELTRASSGETSSGSWIDDKGIDHSMCPSRCERA